MSSPIFDRTIDQLSTAQQHYQAGRFAEAEMLYRQALEQTPENINVLSWLALIADQIGSPQGSVAYYERILALKPTAEAHSNFGAVLARQGRMQEAIAQQQQALALKPNQPDTHYNLGVILYQNGQVEEAIAHYHQVLALNPNYGAAHNNLAMALYKQGHLEDAIAHYQQALAINPDHVNAHNGLGVALFQQGQVAQAIEQYERAIALQPDCFSAYNNLGTALQKQGKLEDAAVNYRQALALKPDYASAHDNLGTLLQEQGQVEDAIAHYQRALALDPNLANAYNNLGSAFKLQGKVDEAIASCLKAIQLQPNHADAHNNYASSLIDQGKFETAIDHYKQAIHHQPDHANAHLNLGIILLLLGDFKQGFEEYHWRWHSRQCSSLRYPQSLWDGSDLNGKVILLTAEQGYGDTIQFARYATLVAQRGGHVVIACQKPLLRLLDTLPGIDRCVDRDKVDVQTNVHAPLLDLPLLLGTTLETIPGDVPYLTPSSDFVLVNEGCGLEASKGSTNLPVNRPFKIGFVWAANPDSSTSSRRSCPLEQFLSLLDIPEVALYSLQKHPSATDLATLQSHPLVHDLREQLHDFADTAAAIAQLDLVISVDTAVAHLAGALGKPVWTLLADIADWRWLRDRDDTPWYPTMKLFRQEREGDWDGVFERVIEALRSMLERGEKIGVTAEAQRRGGDVRSQESEFRRELGDKGAARRDGKNALLTTNNSSAAMPFAKRSEGKALQPTTLLTQNSELSNNAVHLRSSSQRASATQNSSPSSPLSPHPSPLSHNGFNQLKSCRHGTFLYNRNDLYIGRSLELYGEWSEGEVALFQLLLRSGDVVAEIGANIGTHTVFFAKAVGAQGSVLAIEPQRIVFQTLCANLALNSITNVHAYAIGLGEAPGFAQIPALDYHQLNNYGGVSLNPAMTEQQAAGETVQIATLDSFALPRCRLLKIDVEGMELQVLKGAIDTIQRCQPILYIENDRQEHSDALIRYLDAIGYDLYWHRPPIFNGNNFHQNQINVFNTTISVNMLCLKAEHQIVINGLERVNISK